jgi:predicted DNA-binding WGR domain protein
MMITLYKTDKAGRLRFITIHDLQRSLLSGWSLTVASAIGDKSGKDVMHLFDDEDSRESWLNRLLARKRISGYKELYRYDHGEAGRRSGFNRSNRRAG